MKGARKDSPLSLKTPLHFDRLDLNGLENHSVQFVISPLNAFKDQKTGRQKGMLR